MNRQEREDRAQTVERLRGQLDDLRPPFGPSSICGFCGDLQLGQRHRIIDAVAERIRAGDHWEDVCDDYGFHHEHAILALAVSY